MLNSYIVSICGFNVLPVVELDTSSCVVDDGLLIPVTLLLPSLVKVSPNSSPPGEVDCMAVYASVVSF